MPTNYRQVACGSAKGVPEPVAETPVNAPDQFTAEERNRRYWEMAETDDPRIRGPMG